MAEFPQICSHLQRRGHVFSFNFCLYLLIASTYLSHLPTYCIYIPFASTYLSHLPNYCIYILSITLISQPKMTCPQKSWRTDWEKEDQIRYLIWSNNKTSKGRDSVTNVTKVLVIQSVWPDWAIFCTLGNFLKPLATINWPKSFTFLDNFCKGVKIYHFSSEIIFGQLL